MHAKKMILVAGIILLAVIGFGIIIGGKSSNGAPGKYDGLAKCLSENGVKMYGAYWCPHCNNQKEMFGASWRYVDYVECATPEGEAACRNAGVKLFPTWTFGDGSRAEGELSAEQLAAKTGCKL